MTALQLATSTTVRGDGWHAEVQESHITLAVAPAGDGLPVAVKTLFASSQRPYWMVEWTGEDSDGWDLYRLSRNTGLRSVQ